jgi:hypothetical protein
MGFHGRAAAHKPKMIMHNAKRRPNWCKALDSGVVETGSVGWWITLHCLAFRRTNLGLSDARRMLPAPMHSANLNVWWRRNNRLGLFFMVRFLSSSEGKSYTTAYNDILCHSVLPTLWQQFEEGPFLIQHDNATMHKARPIQKWFVEIGVGELYWPAKSCSTSVHSLTNALVTECKFPQQCSNILWKAFPGEWRLLLQRRGDQLHMISHDFGMRYSKNFCSCSV